MIWGLWLISLPALAYTDAELNALAEREQALIRTPPTEDIKAILKKAETHKSDALATAQTVQSLVKSNALTEILGTPTPRENPNRAPRGVMAFVSLTMPDTALKQLLQQSARTEVPLIIRGVLPQGFEATTGRIAKLVGMNSKTPIESGFAISPEWFERFHIQRVPAFVSVKDGHCLPKQPCTPSDYDIVYGNISLYQALTFLEDGDAAENVIPLNQRLRQ
ncbi:hypothetical protein GCM10007938_42630 [Vibrio zhanjiangensis]|uniref:Type-F conjugative transfer system pilin assembly protein TrbC n=2 Tax=Vibrio zhanjiangensis TaxID=1046128 RepID=A0ABQ6F4L1_9VIBR|nr:hypothetical protein GCM10007938_42630 [Vibrio zhanjiangensis]